MTTNQINYWANVERERSNRANEAENYRSHVANETETNRSNVAKETETHRANVERETETKRHNKYEEGVATAKAVTGGFKDITSGVGSLLSPFAKAGMLGG